MATGALAILLLVSGLGVAEAQVGGAPLGVEGAKAYAMARAAEDTAQAAQQEGTTALNAVQEPKASPKDAEALGKLQEEAKTAHEALAGYRKRALASAGEALQLLADGTRVVVAAPSTPPAPPRPADPIRREVFEQKALLAAHEASVMAARARTEAERLRAIHAEVKALLAAAPGVGRDATRPDAASRDVEVPNLVGARLDAAIRDLQVAGLRLGATEGPREGFIVKQTPDAGTRLPRQGAVSVTLSATAAGVKTITPE